MSDSTQLLLQLAYEAALIDEARRVANDQAQFVPGPSVTLGESHRKTDFLCAALYNYARRLVPLRPRRIRMSREFLADQRLAHHRGRVDHLLSLIQDGDPRVNSRSLQFLSENAYQLFHSRRGSLAKPKGCFPALFIDHLLNDWNVHHFHLQPGRGNVLLFAVLHDADCFVLRLGTHGNDFAATDLVQITERNWPGTLKGISNVSCDEPLSADRVRKLRRCSWNYLVQTETGAVTVQDFRAGNGHPVAVKRSQDRVRSVLRQLATELHQGAAGPHGRLYKNRRSRFDSVRARLEFLPMPRPVGFDFANSSTGFAHHVTLPWA